MPAKQGHKGRATPELPQSHRRSTRTLKLPSDTGLLLFNPVLNRLFAFNESARLLWEAIERGSGIDNIASDFVTRYGISFEAARRDVDAMIENWQALDLLSGDDCVPSPAPVRAHQVTDWSQASRACWLDTTVYTVRGKVFSLASDASHSPAMIRSFLRHLETPKAEPGLRLEVRQTADGSSALLMNGREQFRTRDGAQLIGGISQAILEYLHPGVEWLAMMHGGAVMREGVGVVFPATSGSGKTTLIAHLIAQERFTYLADDLIALAAPSGHVVPWPMPLSIKQGSWPLLSGSYPGLQNAPSYETTRGPARLLVSSSTDWNTDPVLVHRIVFPKYSAGTAAKMNQITAFEAIERLLGDRIWLGHPMTEPRVTAFLTWLNETPAYEITYGELDDGVLLIESILG
ncbi:MAG: PqqD family protein [Bradyrhizobium sp.]|nr:PqqD family protein [Bradyrhizobium sp.]